MEKSGPVAWGGGGAVVVTHRKHVEYSKGAVSLWLSGGDDRASLGPPAAQPVSPDSMSPRWTMSTSHLLFHFQHPPEATRQKSRQSLCKGLPPKSDFLSN